MKKIDLSFNFKGSVYDAVIRVRQNARMTEYWITVLNWKLERLLYGNQVIKEVDGALEAEVVEANKDQTELKLVIAVRLGEYLQTPIFVNHNCLLGSVQAESWESFHPLARHKHECLGVNRGL